MSTTLEPNPIATHLQSLHAYIECSDGIQGVVNEMIKILVDPETDADDKVMAMHTIDEALTPEYDGYDDGKYGVDLEVLASNLPTAEPSVGSILDALDREEKEFADRLSNLMKIKSVSQSKLASMIGVSQPAISLMLNRKCRPQKNTVERIAEAMGVECSDLWKDYEEE